MTGRKPTVRGFTRTSAVLQERIRKASESRGFAQSRLLTHWAEIAGPDIASIARPVSVSYGRGGFGATLTVLTTGAQAPILEMQKDRLREAVNGVYGYNAISRISITQTAASGFADGRVSFEHRKAPAPAPAPDPATTRTARDIAAAVGDTSLRDALESLARNVLSKSQRGTQKR